MTTDKSRADALTTAIGLLRETQTTASNYDWALRRDSFLQTLAASPVEQPRADALTDEQRKALETAVNVLNINWEHETANELWEAFTSSQPAAAPLTMTLNPAAPPLTMAPAPVDERAVFPRYTEWLHLCAHGEWSNGVPEWARDYTGRMNAVTAAIAVIEELAAARASANETGTEGATAEAATLLRQARDELCLVEWENDPPNRVQALFDRIEAYVSRAPAQAAEPGAQGAPLTMAINPNAPPLTMTLGPEKAAESVAIPAGHVLVPIEPNGAMLDRAVAFALNVKIGGDYRWTHYIRDLWAAFLAAAPQPPEQADARESGDGGSQS
jgi:hypothetical protein